MPKRRQNVWLYTARVTYGSNKKEGYLSRNNDAFFRSLIIERKDKPPVEVSFACHRPEKKLIGKLHYLFQ